MINQARGVAYKAYCPYSKFRVGAVAKMLNPQTGKAQDFFGCNIENASYGLTICAERVAIFNGVSQGFTRLLSMAVSCLDAKKEDSARFKTPCGACRQVMQEFAVDDRIHIDIDGVGSRELQELLPLGFKL